MTQIPDWVLAEVRRRASIKDLLVSLYGRRAAEKGRYRCPFHEDKTPSLTVSRGGKRREVFRCFGCDRGGDQIEFVKQLGSIEGQDVTSFPKAVRFLAARLGIEWETQSQAEEAGAAEKSAQARRAEKLLSLALNQAGTPEGVLARERLDDLLANMGERDGEPATLCSDPERGESGGDEGEDELPPIYDPPKVPDEIRSILATMGHPDPTLRRLRPQRWHAYWTFGNGNLGEAIKVLWPVKDARAMFYRLVWFRQRWRLAPGIRHGRFQPAGRDLLVRRKTGDVYLDPKSLLLYGCERLTPVPRTQWVVMPEGEKDADAWWRASGQKWPAVATHGGQSGRLNPYQLKQLEGRRVIVMGDLDEAGDRYVERVRAALEGVAETILVLGVDLAAAAGVDPEARGSKGFDLSDALDRVSLDKLVAELGLPAVGERGKARTTTLA